MTDGLVFRSKVDPWLVGVMMIAPVILSVVFVSVASSEGLNIAAISVGAGLVLSTMLTSWVLSSTRYTIARGELSAQSGPFIWTVPLSDIRSVEPSRSLQSAPALSLDRLAIRHGAGGLLLVSPKDRDGFLAALKARRPA